MGATLNSESIERENVGAGAAGGAALGAVVALTVASTAVLPIVGAAIGAAGGGAVAHFINSALFKRRKQRSRRSSAPNRN
jgi:hypothetical protein